MWILRRVLLAEFEQAYRIGAADLFAIGLADARHVEPVGCVVDVLERPVGREQDAVGADLEDRVDQRLRAEVARRGGVEVGVEVVDDLVLRLVLVPPLHPRVAVVDAPHAVRQAFAHVAEHDLDLGVLVEETRADEAQRVHRGFLAEGPGRPYEPRMAVINLRVCRQWVARMQIEGIAELLDLRPERPVLRQVEIHGDVGSMICEKPLTSAPLNFRSCMQRRYSLIAPSTSCSASAAKPWKRSGRFATTSASASLARRARSVAFLGSGIAWMAGALSDRIIISMPCLSISPRRLS